MDAAAHRRNGADIAVGRQPALRSLLHFYLHLIGFTASTLLLTWGLFALFFVALGGDRNGGLVARGLSMDGAIERVAFPGNPEKWASHEQVDVAEAAE